MNGNLFLNITSYFPEVLQNKVNTLLPIFNCLVINVGTILSLKGFKDLEFMLCRNMNFCWGLSDKQVIISCDLFPTLEDLKTIDGILFVNRQYESTDHMLQEISKKLYENTPQIIDIDQYYIPGFIYYNREHRLHTSMVVGLDVSEVYLQDLADIRRIPLASFIESLKLNDLTMLECKVGSKKINYDFQLVKTLIRKNFHYAIEQDKIDNIEYPHLFPFDGRDEIVIYCGIEAIMRFADDLSVLVARINREKLHEILSKMGSKIYEVVVQRYWHIAFLYSTRRLLNNSSLFNELVELLNKIVQDWKIVHNMFHKASVKLEDNIILRISKRLYRIAGLEKEFFLKIKELLM
jgi:hypothetical protein